MGHDIGSRIKKIRKSQRVTLKMMSQATGLSESYLSQVERGVCSASVASLEKIADYLKTNPDTFLVEEADRRAVLHEHNFICPSGKAYYYEILSSDEMAGKRILCQRVTMLPHRESETFPVRKRGFFYIISGYLDIELNGVGEQLFPGDSLYHDETMEFSCCNKSPYLARFLYVTYQAEDEVRTCREK